MSGVDLHKSILATVFIFLLGSALHFAFEWSGGWRPLALFAAANESVWEHLKIAFWPGLLWAAMRARSAAVPSAPYWAAQGLGLLATSIAIIGIFYGYTAILGDNVLAIDIATFALAILLGQIVGEKTLHSKRTSLRLIHHLLLFAQIIAFAMLTYFPPEIFLFQDSRNGLYGFEAHQAGPSS